MKSLLIIVCGSILLGTTSCHKTDDSFTIYKNGHPSTERWVNGSNQITVFVKSQSGKMNTKRETALPGPPTPVTQPSPVRIPFVNAPTPPSTEVVTDGTTRVPTVNQ